MAEMRVVEHGEGGGPEVLHLGTRPVPEPAAGEVLVRVLAAGVNGPDVTQRKGNSAPPSGASDLIGLEVSGEVVGTGPDVTRWRKGDMVCGLCNGGGYAEYVAIPAGQCLPIPDGIDPVDAAGFPETFFTVWSNVWHGHDVPTGATMLVHGGGGGIGSTAVQLGVALGLRVFTTAGSEASRGLATEMGAERVIDYKSEDFVEIVRAAGGADIIVDFMGGDYVERNMKAARADCRIVQLAFDRGAKVELSLGPIMMKRIVYTGSTLRPRPPEFKAAVAAELAERVWPLFGQGRLHPVTRRIFPFAEARAAHEAMEAPGHAGKILLRP
ncbi:MAG TPA: NAD(P)H-quinone oxidoreductase [Paracoccaceae bacterium]|nr:NAD(P)H-quinone oxidoreductase [Paracoccaceae bacterium]